MRTLIYVELEYSIYIFIFLNSYNSLVVLYYTRAIYGVFVYKIVCFYCGQGNKWTQG